MLVDRRWVVGRAESTVHSSAAIIYISIRDGGNKGVSHLNGTTQTKCRNRVGFVGDG